MRLNNFLTTLDIAVIFIELSKKSTSAFYLMIVSDCKSPKETFMSKTKTHLKIMTLICMTTICNMQNSQAGMPRNDNTQKYFKNEKEILRKEISELSNFLGARNKEEAEVSKQIPKMEADLKSLGKKVAALRKYKTDFNSNLDSFQSNYAQILKNYNLKFFNPEKKYLQCLGSVVLDKYTTTSWDNCEKKLADVKDQKILDLRTFYVKKLKINFKEIDKRINEYQTKINVIASELNFARNRNFDVPNETGLTPEQVKEKIASLNIDLNELETFEKSYGNILECSSDTPYVNIEKEFIMEGSSTRGTLYNTPRDDQSILRTGTCYSHFTKDAIVAATKGAVVPSYLDMAFQNSMNLNSSLVNDGGNPCAVINELKKAGICPMQYSILEIISEKIRLDPTYKDKTYQILDFWNIISRLQDSLISVPGNSSSVFVKSVRENPYAWKKTFEQNENLNTPIVEVSNQFYQHYQILTFFSMVTRNYPLLWRKENGDQILFEKNIFNKQSILNNKFDAYMTSRWGNQIESLCGNYKESNYQPCSDLAQEIATSYIEQLTQFYLKSYPGIKVADLAINKSQMKKNVFTTLRHPAYNTFLKKLKLLIENVNGQMAKISGVNPDVVEKEILSENGGWNFFLGFRDAIRMGNTLTKSMNENFLVFLDAIESHKNLGENTLVMTFMAPKCLDQKNRIELPKNISCETSLGNPILSDNADKEMSTLKFRHTILKALLAPRPVPYGNLDFSIGPHINSIVGIRYNPKKNNCDYLIRDSNYAVTRWQEEEFTIKSNRGHVIVKLKD